MLRTTWADKNANTRQTGTRSERQLAGSLDSTGAFRRLAPLGMGVLPVTVELAGAAPTLPATDEETP